MFNKLQTNLAFKGALYTVITATLLGLLISSFIIWSNFEQRNQRTTALLNSLVVTTLPAINLATYHFNTRLNKQLIDGLATHPSILNAAIIDSKGGEVGISTVPTACIPSNVSSLLLGSNHHYEYQITNQGVYLGKLIIEMNQCQQSDLFIDDIKHTFISGIIYSIGIALIIYIMLYRLVSLPISQLANRLKKLDPNSIELTSVQRINSQRKDEIGVLSNRFADLLRMIHDHISRLKAAEYTINDYSNNLEALVNKRTETISGINNELKTVNSKLEDSQKNSEKLNQSQLQLLNNLSNELRAPLATTIQTLQQLQDANITTAQHSRLETSISQNEKIVLLLNELEQISQLKYALGPLATSPLNIHGLISKIEDKIILCEEARYSIDVRYELNVNNNYTGNTQQIEQLLYNLTANILNNATEQRLKINVSESQQGILFQLSAPGLRLPDNLFEQMVLPLSNSFTNNPLTSMGLAYAKDLTELLKGNIHISLNSQNENELTLQLPLIKSTALLESLRERLPKGGIRISMNQKSLTNKIQQALKLWNFPHTLLNNPSDHPVLLITDHIEQSEYNDIGIIIGIGALFENKKSHNGIPLLTIEQMNESQLFNSIISSCNKIQTDQSSTKLSKILLVEDNIINRMLSQRFLRNLNTEIDTAEDGKEAAGIASRKHYDLIFMDCQMPIMDGFQATKLIRRTQLNQKTPIIALTGLESEDERHACLQAGMNDFISKPFTQEQLHSALKQWLP